MDQAQADWRKSSRSGNGSNCVEVADWRKSSRSGNGSDCVEVVVVQESETGTLAPRTR
jgi:hypothetical protein